MPRQPQVLFVGLVDYMKGVDLLLSAWEEVAPQGYRLLIIGDGPHKAEMEARHPSSQVVYWTGRLGRAEVLREIGRSRLLVLPSRCYEGFPMVVLEAMSLGTPVVVPDHGPFPEIIADGRNGRLFAPGDVVSLGEVAREMLALAEGAYEGYGRQRERLMRLTIHLRLTISS